MKCTLLEPDDSGTMLLKPQSVDIKQIVYDKPQKIALVYPEFSILRGNKERNLSNSHCKTTAPKI